MEPQGPQVRLVEKNFVLTEDDMLDQHVQDISNLTPASTKHINEECEENLNPKRKKMQGLCNVMIYVSTVPRS